MSPTPDERPRRPLWREYAEVLGVSILIALFARTFLVQAFEIPSGSMRPTLMAGDHVLVNKMIFAPVLTRVEHWLLPMREVRRGDVVVFQSIDNPRRNLVKRCVAIGGDRVAAVDKLLFVNGQPIDEPYVRRLDPHVYPSSSYLHPSVRHRDNFGPVEVPEGELFCLGDNRDFSRDSRVWGSLSTERVVGRALAVYWSDRAGPVPDEAVAETERSPDSGPERDPEAASPEPPVPRLVR